MSDNSSSTGSTGSSTNSWTLLSPEEAAVENVGPVDDGTESLGDVPSLSEDVTGAAASDIAVETVLSEEGHQHECTDSVRVFNSSVCQETSPESGEGPIPSSPIRMSPLPADLIDRPDLDLESQPPVIHDIVTSSPSDNEHLGATPFVTNIDSGALLDIAAADFLTAEPEECCSAPPLTETHPATEQVLDASADFGPSSVFAAEPEVNVAIETLTATGPPSCVDAESTEPPSQVPESLGTESPINDSPAPETVGPVEAEEKEEVVVEEEVAGEAAAAVVAAAVEKEEMELPETVTQYEREQEEGEEEDEEEEGGESSSTFELGETCSFDDGLRRRNAPSFESPRPRTSDEEDDEEDVEFKLAERTEEKPWFSLNKCIVGSLILLFLGSLFLSGDFDASELSDGEQNQDGLSSDPQYMKELLDKLTRENQQITQLETQLQAQKEELDSALEAVAASGDEKGEADLHKENVKLKEELLSLPELKKELESLRSRVTELSQLSADQEKPPATSSSGPQPGDKDGQSNEEAAGLERRKDTSKGGRLKEDLQRQKVLLEESKKRLQGMRKDGGERKRVRNSLEEIQKKLSEQVERWSKKKPQEAKWKGNKGKNNEREHWKKEVKKEWKHSKEGEEKKGKEWNSHKETWRKHQDEWEKKKDERRMDREERRKEKPGPGKNSQDHHQHQHQQHQPRQRHQCQHNGYWREQEQKLRRNVRAQPGCGSAEDCAGKEGLYPVELAEFEELLEGYLSKLEGSSAESKDQIRKLTATFFEDGGFIHDRVRFGDFVEDVADILEDVADALEEGGREDADSLEAEMEEFEREALWKFAATV